MGWLDWLFRLLLPRPPRRDISRLAGPEADLEELVEEVDVSGGPWRPGHRRLALRDRRLLPKRKPTVVLVRRQRPHYFARSEAARLFAATMRTQDRGMRDLLTDVAQLERLGLPVWRDETEFAAALGLSVGQLRHFSIHRCRERVCHYVTFEVPKRSGGTRLIMAPKRRLKAIQRTLLGELAEKLPVDEHAHGFRRGRSIRTGAEPHVGRGVLLHLDLADFFGSVHFGRVRGLLVAYGYSFPVATTLAVLMTEAPRQPVVVEGARYHVPVGSRHCVQGAPTSPALCNAVALRLDRRLAGLARHFGAAYTRYADDLTFSLDGTGPAAQVHALRQLAERIIRAEGFAPNPAKTHIQRRGGAQKVTGVTVNETLGLSRQERRRIRAQAHRLGREVAQGQADAARLAALHGTLAYVHMLNPVQADALRERWIAQGGPWPIPRVARRPAAAPAPAKAARASRAPSASGPALVGRRFEYRQGSSDKFWVIALQGSSFATHWGRRGTRGQSKTKAFASPAEARKAYDRLVADKLREGYVEVNQGPAVAVEKEPGAS